MFLNKELEFDKKSEDEFEEGSDEKSDEESDNESDEESNEESDEESDKESEDKSRQNNEARVGLTATCSTIYAREKLVRILNGKTVIPKQRWGIDKILATLTYY